jgi:hypothetical protein
MTNGIVRAANQRRQRYAIQTADGYTLVDLIDGELNINDEVSGVLDEHEEVILKNLTTGDTVEVRIDAIHVPDQSVAKNLAK